MCPGSPCTASGGHAERAGPATSRSRSHDALQQGGNRSLPSRPARGMFDDLGIGARRPPARNVFRHGAGGEGTSGRSRHTGKAPVAVGFDRGRAVGGRRKRATRSGEDRWRRCSTGARAFARCDHPSRGPDQRPGGHRRSRWTGTTNEERSWLPRVLAGPTGSPARAAARKSGSSALTSSLRARPFGRGGTGVQRQNGVVIRRKSGRSRRPSTPIGMVAQRRVRLLERNSGSQKLKIVP